MNDPHNIKEEDVKEEDVKEENVNEEVQFNYVPNNFNEWIEWG